MLLSHTHTLTDVLKTPFPHITPVLVKTSGLDDSSSPNTEVKSEGAPKIRFTKNRSLGSTMYCNVIFIHTINTYKNREKQFIYIKRKIEREKSRNTRQNCKRKGSGIVKGSL